MALLDPLGIAIALLTMGVLAIFSYKKRIVTKSGLAAAFIVGIGIWTLASWTWFILILLFFVISALFTHYKYNKKREFGAAQDKGGARTWSNVLANGLLPLSVVIVSFVLTLVGGGLNAYGRTTVGFGPLVLPAFPLMGIAFAAFIGAISTATADTLATEIGLLNRTPPRLITKPWKIVPPGTSGGVSTMGWLATVLGTLMIGGLAALIALPHWYFVLGTTLMPELGGFAPITMLILALVGGFIGCTFDSFLGATWQGMWYCRMCDKQTEKRSHCGEPADYLRGSWLLDNNMVNLLSGVVGALAAVLLYIFFLSIGLV